MLNSQHLNTAAALALALGALAPAAASGGPIQNTSAAATATQPQPTRIVRVIVPQNGFDWGDAGIGAAGGLALSMLGIGGAIVISSQRRTRHPNSPVTNQLTSHHHEEDQHVHA